MIYRAHCDDAQAISAAQVKLMNRYSGSAYRYLARVLGDLDAADQGFKSSLCSLCEAAFDMRTRRGDDFGITSRSHS